MEDFRKEDLRFGKIISVDGYQIVVKAEKLVVGHDGGQLHVEVGAFVNCGSGHGDTICLISRVFIQELEQRTGPPIESKVVELSIIGSLNEENHFGRGAERLPTISCDVFLLNGDQINHLIGVINTKGDEIQRYFQVGKRPMLGSGDVHFNLDKLLGRHVAILGTTGSGKSCTVARIVQSILRDYPQPRILFFDIHDEYSAAFQGEWASQSNCIKWANFTLPYWFLDFEEFISIYYPDAGGTQKMFIKSCIEELKKKSAEDIKDRISVDSPVFFDIDEVLVKMGEQIDALTSSKKDPFIKMKLRFESIRNDTRYYFLGKDKENKKSLEEYLKWLLGLDKNAPNYISILDLSGLPSEIRSICVGVLARLCFDYCYWDFDPENLPIALVLEEAHTYIPDEGSLKYKICLDRIETIAKEGRKYGLSLMVVSQRPSNVSSTVLSQCGTFITLRLTNDTDQNKIRRLLPDTLGDQVSVLPSLRDGEALVSGDAVALPGKVYFDRPSPEPKSRDVAFHKAWTNGTPSDYDIQQIIFSWKSQNRKPKT